MQQSGSSTVKSSGPPLLAAPSYIDRRITSGARVRMHAPLTYSLLADGCTNRRNGVVQIGQQAKIRKLEDRGVGIFIDRDDDLTVLDSGHMLGRARNSSRNVEVRSND